jgi:PAT family beta-lactamase induction signal transducer AmpG
MEIVRKQTFSETFSVYLDRRMPRILLLGIISGFPWVIIGSSLSLWLQEDGLSRSTIGWAGLIFSVYAINYLWAPIVDRVNKFSQIIGFILILFALVLPMNSLFSGVEFKLTYYYIFRSLVFILLGGLFLKTNLFSGLDRISAHLEE